MRSWLSFRKMSSVAACAVASVLCFGVIADSSAAPAAANLTALALPTAQERADQNWRGRLMLGLPTRVDRLAGEAPFWMNGKRMSVRVVAPLRGDVQDATELALTVAPDAPPMLTAFNRVIVKFDGAVDLAEATRRLRRAGLQGEIRPMRAPSAYLVQTRSAIDALRLSDALHATPGVRYAHPDGVGQLATGDERGAAPEIRVEDANGNIATGGTVDFGSTTQGVALNRIFTVYNDGDANLSVANPTVDGDFTLVVPISATSIPPAGSANFTVQMAADAPGALSGTVSFLNSDADENPFEIDLIGEVDALGGVQEIQITQNGVDVPNDSTFNFGETPQNVPVTRVFTITNLGGQPLSVNTVMMVGAGFTIVTQPTTPVAPGQFTEFSVRLDAATLGGAGAALEILNNDADENPFNFLIEGVVVEPIPDGEIGVFNDNVEITSGGSLSFGTTEEGVPVAVTLVVENTGSGVLSLGQVLVPAGFSVAQPPPATINPNDEGTIALTLDAIYAGNFSGEITIENDDPNENPFVIVAAGTVTPLDPTGGIDDANYTSQWHHLNDGSEGGNVGFDARTPDAWEYTLGDGVTVAVMDNGSQPDHPDYNDNVVGEYLNVLDPGTGADGDHGTAVAGLVAAEANFSGGRGTAPEAQLFLTNTFNIDFSETSDAFYAADNAGAAIHTNSWSFNPYYFLPDVIADAIRDLAVNGRGGKGMYITFAAGNSALPVAWTSLMATMPETVTIGALDNTGQRSWYSAFGPWLDYVAPSNGGTRGIFTTDLTGIYGYNGSQSADGGDFTSTFGGTSAATPISAGVAALLFSVNPDLYASQVRRILQQTARVSLVTDSDRGFERLTGFSDTFGYGLIDANAAVEAAIDSLFNGGLTWPAPATDIVATRSGLGATVTWSNPSAADPQNEFAGAMLVRYGGQLLWTPVDGQSYIAGDSPSVGVRVLALGDLNAFVDTQATMTSNQTYAVYTYNAAFNYSAPIVFRLFPREPVVFFFDDMEGDDPGWAFSTGGSGPLLGLPGDPEPNNWERGEPNTQSFIFDDFLELPYPPAIEGFNAAYSGTRVWATNLDGNYTTDTDHILVSPPIDLADPDRIYGSFSLSWREVMDIVGNGFDRTTVRLVDASTGSVIRTLFSGNQPLAYQWREQWFDIRNQEGRTIQIVFELSSEDAGTTLSGWQIDDVRIGASVGNSGPTPPAGPRRIILPGFGVIPEMSVEAGSGGDITYDGLVTMDDAVELLQQFGSTRSQSDFSFDADLDGNGRIGVGDFALMLAIIQGQPVTSEAAGNAVIDE